MWYQRSLHTHSLFLCEGQLELILYRRFPFRFGIARWPPRTPECPHPGSRTRVTTRCLTCPSRSHRDYVIATVSAYQAAKDAGRIPLRRQTVAPPATPVGWRRRLVHRVTAWVQGGRPCGSRSCGSVF